MKDNPDVRPRWRALSSAHMGTIPVIFTTFALGETLRTISEDIDLETDAETVTPGGDNVVATVWAETAIHRVDTWGSFGFCARWSWY